jgi:crotonobetainyl-CoA:carnitine CoA-transferase CaiB-like acyl-CoA transferase
VRLSGTPLKVGDVPRPGEHRAEILRDVLAYDDASVEELAASGAFGEVRA